MAFPIVFQLKLKMTQRRGKLRASLHLLRCQFVTCTVLRFITLLIYVIHKPYEFSNMVANT